MSWKRGHGTEAHEVLAQHRLDVDVGAGAQLVEAGAGHAVAAEHHGRAVVLDPEADGRLDRPVVGGGGERRATPPCSSDHAVGRPRVTSSCGGSLRSSWWAMR